MAFLNSDSLNAWASERKRAEQLLQAPHTEERSRARFDETLAPPRGRGSCSRGRTHPTERWCIASAAASIT